MLSFFFKKFASLLSSTHVSGRMLFTCLFNKLVKHCPILYIELQLQ
jgi:hypothetical protein